MFGKYCISKKYFFGKISITGEIIPPLKMFQKEIFSTHFSEQKWEPLLSWNLANTTFTLVNRRQIWPNN
jgi:hypothetical protein